MDDAGPVGSIVLNSVFRDLSTSDYYSLAGLAVGMLTCLFFSAICSSSENAFFSHQEHDMEELMSKKQSGGKVVLYLLNYPKHLLATILVLNSLMAVSFVLFSTLFSDILLNMEGREVLRFMIDAILVTLVILIFGEVIPKVYATRNYRKVALLLAYPMRVFMFLFWPLTNVLVKATSVLEKRIKQTAPELTPEELSQAIDITADVINAQQEKDILKGIVNIGQTHVGQIMRPRMDMVALDDTMDFHQVMEMLRNHRFSRMPVFQDNLDHITGVLNMKDVLDCLDESATFNWKSRMRQPFFVPENKKIDDLLHEFRLNRNHLAIVVDEFGGTNGIVTLEDVLEEVFGDIQDEFDDEAEQYSRLDDHTYLFEGKTPIVDFLRITQLPIQFFDEGNMESETLGGIITEIAGKIPSNGEVINYLNIAFHIDAADLRKVKRVKVVLHETHDENE